VIDSSNAYNQVSAPIVCTPLHGPVQFAIHKGVRLVRHVFFPKLPHSLQESSPPRNTLFLWPSLFITPNGISTVFVWIPNDMLYNALLMEKNLKLPFPLGISSPCRRRTKPRPEATCTKRW